MGVEEVVTDSVADALKQGMNQRNEAHLSDGHPLQ